MKRRVTFITVMLAVAAVWLLAGPGSPVEQPLAFDHATHDQTGCLVCHQGSETGVRAGLPEGAICLQCHATAPDVAGADDAWRHLAAGQEIPWMRVTRVADHVFFSHRRHVALAGLDCVSCHGDVGHLSSPPSSPARRLDMDACEACHHQEDVSDDCAACHR